MVIFKFKKGNPEYDLRQKFTFQSGDIRISTVSNSGTGE